MLSLATQTQLFLDSVLKSWIVFPPASKYCCRANSKSESKRIPLRRLVNGIRRGVEALESLHTKERSSGREPAMSITAGSIIAHTISVIMSTTNMESCQQIEPSSDVRSQRTRKHSQVTSSPMRICITDVFTQLAMAALAISLAWNVKQTRWELTKPQVL